MKKSTKITSIIILCLLFCITCGIIFFTNQSMPVSKTEQDLIRVEIPSGCSVKKAASVLKQNNLIKNEQLFYIYARFPILRKVFFSKTDNNTTFVLKSGIYNISPDMNIAEIQNLLTSGQQEFIKLSIPEGLTISKIAAILEENRICNASDFKDSCKNIALLQEYKLPANSFEGFLFPDTYFLNINMNSNDVVKLMVNTFFEKIQTIPNILDKSIDELYEIIKLASIVEREYRVPEEAPLIASVFKNRLKQNIGLYSCATIEYILTEIEGRPHPGKILIEDTKIDNAYNTYKWAGLPPGPISNPGLISIDAATNTPKTNYFFFQVVNPEEGRHIFTTTFEEHKVSHNLYLKK